MRGLITTLICLVPVTATAEKGFLGLRVLDYAALKSEVEDFNIKGAEPPCQIRSVCA